MKYRGRVDDRTFEVDVSDVQARPIIATVEGQRFEVWPETATATAASVPRTEASGPVVGVAPAPAGPALDPRRSRRTSGEAAAPPATAGKVVYAPIPGVIESVAVRPGEKVVVGQALCVLEAMKMKNVIRAAQEATVGEICVTPGQHVKHNDVLVKYTES
jgi:glutaconyl-CoA/methylmalonyl-CoA decarboxylase subunit gamma